MTIDAPIQKIPPPAFVDVSIFNYVDIVVDRKLQNQSEQAFSSYENPQINPPHCSDIYKIHILKSALPYLICLLCI